MNLTERSVRPFDKPPGVGFQFGRPKYREASTVPVLLAGLLGALLGAALTIITLSIGVVQ